MMTGTVITLAVIVVILFGGNAVLLAKALTVKKEKEEI